MERIKALIDKLYTQKEQGAAAAQLLVTVQLLQAELLQAEKASAATANRRVSVVMPFKSKIATPLPASVPAEPEPEQSKVVYTLDEAEPERKLDEGDEPVFYPPVKEGADKQQEATAESPQPEDESTGKPEEVAPVTTEATEKKETIRPYFLQKPAVTEALVLPPVAETPAAALPEAPPPEPEPVNDAELQPEATPSETRHFDAVMETPTLAQHQPQKEVHQLIAAELAPSLNDKLRQESKELGHHLTDAPIKDLRKGIGINDRFSFVNILFRGDDSMYERSIRTINNFGALAEAEYWISRELKFKLGWNESSETVQHFYSLVRRRFA